MNYLRLASKCFSNFRPPPTESEVYGWIGEYIDSNLLFVWQVGRQLWGEWDTSPSLMPKFKTRRDNESPVPDKLMRSAWISSYHSGNKEFVKSFRNTFETFLSSIGIVVGIGIGIGIEEVKNISASEADAGVCEVPVFQLKPTEERASAPSAKIIQSIPDGFFEFWKLRWRSEDKAAAIKAFRKMATSDQRINQIMNGVRADSPHMLSRPKDKRPYMSTWLSKERFDDEDEPDELLNQSPNGSAGRQDSLAYMQKIQTQKGDQKK